MQITVDGVVETLPDGKEEVGYIWTSNFFILRDLSCYFRMIKSASQLMKTIKISFFLHNHIHFRSKYRLFCDTLNIRIFIFLEFCIGSYRNFLSMELLEFVIFIFLKLNFLIWKIEIS